MINFPDELYPATAVVSVLEHNIQNRLYKHVAMPLPSKDAAKEWVERNNTIPVSERDYSSWDRVMGRKL